MTRKPRLLLIALAVVAAIGATGGAVVMNLDAAPPAAAQQKPATPKPSMTVELVQPSQVTWPQTLAANGALAAWQEAVIAAETGGLRIVALHADVGQQVKRGELLAELASETMDADVRMAEAKLASARAAHNEARANLRRAEAVRESGAMSKQQIEQIEIAEQRAAADFASAKAALESAKIKLGQTRIVAVDDGVISERKATLGTVVGSGTELFRLVRDGRVEWRAEFDANQLAQLQQGQTASVILPDGATVEGKVRQLSPTLDPGTRTGLAYVDLSGNDNLRPGMYVKGKVVLGERPALTLPSSAITLRDGRSYVFEVDPQTQTVKQREVATGRTQGERVEITSELKPGTQVVRQGGAFLNDGDAVRIVNGVA